MKKRAAFLRSPAGFTLVEVSISLGVVGFCLIVLLGLMPVGLTASGDAGERTRAINIATAVAADFENAKLAAGASFLYQIPVLDPDPDDDEDQVTSFEVTATGARYAKDTNGNRINAQNPRYIVTVSRRRLSAHGPLQASIRVAWPSSGPRAGQEGQITVLSTFNPQS